MRRFFILAAAALAILSGCAHPTSSQSPRINALSLNQEDLDFAYALSRYSAGVAEELDRGPANNRSVNFFLEAARHDPSNYRLVRKAAIGLLYRRRAVEAAELLETASALNPTHYPLLLDLAQAYELGEQPQKQAETYKKAIDLSPSESAAYIAFARKHLAAGKLREALEVLEEGSQKSDRELMRDLALLNAAALLKGGFARKSVDWFMFVAKNSEPDEKSRMHLVIAEIYEGLGETNSALNHYETAARAESCPPEAFVRMAIIAAESDYESGLKILDTAERRFPMNDIVLGAIAYISRTQPNRNMAADLLVSIAKRSSSDPTVNYFLQLGACYEQDALTDKAAEAFKKGLSLYPESPEILNYLAYMWAEAGVHLDEAEKLSLKSIRIEPENGAYLDTLAWIYYKQGRNDMALELIHKALEQMPDDPVVNDHYGDALKTSGRVKEATEAWLKSYRLDSSNSAVLIKLKKHNAAPKSVKTDQ